MFHCRRPWKASAKRQRGIHGSEKGPEERLLPQPSKLYPSHRTGISDIEILHSPSGRSPISLIFTAGTNCNPCGSDKKNAINYFICCSVVVCAGGGLKNFFLLTEFKLKKLFIFQHSPKTN